MPQHNCQKYHHITKKKMKIYVKIVAFMVVKVIAKRKITNTKPKKKKLKMKDKSS